MHAQRGRDEGRLENVGRRRQAVALELEMALRILRLGQHVVAEAQYSQRHFEFQGDGLPATTDGLQSPFVSPWLGVCNSPYSRRVIPSSATIDS